MIEPTERYPVIIEVTTQHVVWVDADSQQDAVKHANDYPFYELISDNETAATFWHSVAAPAQYDWDTVYPRWGSDGSYIGRDANAHVEWHRHHLQMQEWAAEKAACTEAGHPDMEEEPLSDGRRWCKGCREYLPAPVEVA